MNLNRAAKSYLKREAKKWPAVLVNVPRDQWPDVNRDPRRTAVWRSCDFLMQVFDVAPGIVRLSVNRIAVGGRGWRDGISWDELQMLKRQAGFGSFDAVETYPAESDVVNDANMRHLFVFVDRRHCEWIWRRIMPGGDE